MKWRAAFLLAAVCGWEVPRVAAQDGDHFEITHAELHVGDGSVVADATIEIRDGKVVRVEEPKGHLDFQ